MKHTSNFSRRTQSGQVLVWFLGFAASMAVVFAGVYSVGQATSEKQKIVNAADAAAYSGALTEARALNLASYTNRSVIANEVLVAQLVSLDSWTSYFAVATDNYAKLFGVLKSIPVPILNVFLAGMEITMKALNQIVTPVANGLDSSIPTVIRAWELIYQGWYNATIVPAFTPPVMALAAKSAAEKVLANNVSSQGGRIDIAPKLVNVGAFAVANELEWNRLTMRYTKSGTPGTASDKRKNAADLLLVSRDEFSKNRPGSDVFFIKLFFGNSSQCFYPLLRVGSEKLGSTQLKNYERWEAQDTVEYKVKTPLGINCSWGKGTVAVPAGWGRATADKNSTKGNIMNTSGGAGALAYGRNHANGAWSGVKELYDVERDSSGKPRQENATYAVAVAKNKTDIKNNESLGFVSRPMTGVTGSPDLNAGFAKEQIGAVSEATIFFSRPVRNSRDITAGNLFRADTHQEYASLYNPYWQVRLKSPSATNRIIAYGASGLNPALIPFAQ
jgi:Putative Flp pilus-assembly TadE/G-like